MLRDEGFFLTPEQYARFRQALLLGFGSKSTEDLRQLCRLLWVKPSTNYDEKKFERVFKQFVEKLPKLPPSQKIDDLPDVSEDDRLPAADAPPKVPAQINGEMPTLPPRVFPGEEPEQKEADVQVPSAIAVAPESQPGSAVLHSNYSVTPTTFPVSEADWYHLWLSLKKPTPIRRERELDVRQTINRLEREGPDCDPVLIPLLSRRSNLVIWLDTSNAMMPFQMVFQPLIHLVRSGRIHPAEMHYFTTVPLQFVYPWQHPTQAEPIDRVLSRLHRQRTIAVILSDAGAASRRYNLKRVNKTNEFLEKLAPCVQQVIWVNPLPKERWKYSSAVDIAQFLDGRMYPLSLGSLNQIKHDRQRRFLPTAQSLVGGWA
jgi:hypothetical protein